MICFMGPAKPHTRAAHATELLVPVVAASVSLMTEPLTRAGRGKSTQEKLCSDVSLVAPPPTACIVLLKPSGLGVEERGLPRPACPWDASEISWIRRCQWQPYLFSQSGSCAKSDFCGDSAILSMNVARLDGPRVCPSWAERPGKKHWGNQNSKIN